MRTGGCGEPLIMARQAAKLLSLPRVRLERSVDRMWMSACCARQQSLQLLLRHRTKPPCEQRAQPAEESEYDGHEREERDDHECDTAQQVQARELRLAELIGCVWRRQ